VTGLIDEVEAHQHGLRTPIAAIAGLADAALQREDLDRDLVKQLRAIRQLASEVLAALDDRDERPA
jgi:signal transduction histidine kinase